MSVQRRIEINGNLLSRRAVRPPATNGVAADARSRTWTLTFTAASAGNRHGPTAPLGAPLTNEEMTPIAIKVTLLIPRMMSGHASSVR